MVTLMRIVTMTGTLAVIGCLGTTAASQTYTDQELLELFQTQRDIFREAEQSTTGKTRGLTWTHYFFRVHLPHDGVLVIADLQQGLHRDGALVRTLLQ